MIDSPHTLLIGVDGGGTGCRAAVGTPTDGVLAKSEGGRANVASDPELAIKNIIDAVTAAAAKCGLTAKQLKTATAHLGLAGVMTAQDAHMVASAVPYGNVTVSDDRPTALNGALGWQDGFLLSVGTGTIAAACTDGVYRSVGGWGFHVGDQASGSWLGQESLRHVLLCHDGLALHSDLTRALLAKFQNDPNEIVAFSMSAKPGDYGTFAPDVVESARANDLVGQKIIGSGVEYLRKCLNALGFKAGDALCLTGGVGPHYANYLPSDITAGLVACKGNALDGAFNFARAHFEKHPEAQI
ncbi:glucosamine kinase [Shimia gijangensis]|uniref:Glucosamine kinase n=1 Tax=Shimia gijangensis TaxID=1470563 RepID=A0A1M6IUD4_9RHOB|nr:BadF/BadG/BcrA/BcrD ATPase family protein [Shimia gijangensis]SHJ38032.1 glucosamine kinase [Shimia gijangensis]